MGGAVIAEQIVHLTHNAALGAQAVRLLLEKFLFPALCGLPLGDERLIQLAALLLEIINLVAGAPHRADCRVVCILGGVEFFLQLLRSFASGLQLLPQPAGRVLTFPQGSLHLGNAVRKLSARRLLSVQAFLHRPRSQLKGFRFHGFLPQILAQALGVSGLHSSQKSTHHRNDTNS